MNTQPANQPANEIPLSPDGTALTSPRAIACSDCRAPKLTACKRVKPGRKVQVQYLKNEHAARRDEFNRLLTAANTAAQSDQNGTSA